MEDNHVVQILAAVVEAASVDGDTMDDRGVM